MLYRVWIKDLAFVGSGAWTLRFETTSIDMARAERDAYEDLGYEASLVEHDPRIEAIVEAAIFNRLKQPQTVANAQVKHDTLGCQCGKNGKALWAGCHRVV